MTIEEKIRAIMDAAGWKQQQFAEAIPVAQSTVNRWLQGSEPEGHRRDRIEELYREHVGQPRKSIRFVPIVGKAGAGPEGTVLFATGDRNFGEIEAPLDAAPSARALEVQGNSMYGVANDGWIIFFEDKETPSAEHMGELCVCFLEDERVLVKIPYPGSQRGLYNLDSANAPPMRDVAVRAFAIVTDIKTRRAAQRFIRRNPDHPIEDLKIA